MPFTLSHPAAVIFFKNKYFNLMGLILGSMAPDFIYFLLFSPSSGIGHTLSGFIILNLPLCLILNYLFYTYIQEIFILTLPNFISKNYIYLLNKKNKLTTLKEYLVFIYSCIIGMITHIFWDAFTHNTGFFVENIDFLKNEVLLLNYNIPVYKILQHSSTLIGLLIVILFFFKIKNKGSITTNKINKKKFIFYIFIVQALTLIISYFLSIHIEGNFPLGRFVVTVVNGLFLGYLFSGIIYNKLNTTYK